MSKRFKTQKQIILESLQGKIKSRDKIRKKIKAQADLIPELNEQDMEDKALEKAIEAASDDQVEEIYGKFIPTLKKDEKRYKTISGLMSNTYGQFKEAVASTNGTATVMVSYSLSLPQSPLYNSGRSWILPHFQEVVEYKTHKTEIPKRLNQLRAGLGDMFSLVHDNVEKAKGGTMNDNQAILDMREVLSQLWGNLVNRAVIKSPETFKDIKNRALAKASHRRLVAESLIGDPEDRRKFEFILEQVYDLYNEMSDTKTGKNPLLADQAKLEVFFNRWIIQIDGALRMIDWDNI